MGDDLFKTEIGMAFITSSDSSHRISCFRPLIRNFRITDKRDKILQKMHQLIKCVSLKAGRSKTSHIHHVHTRSAHLFHLNSATKIDLIH